MLINKYSKLFHKYLLNISNCNDDIEYTYYPDNLIIKPNTNRIVHLHIIDINNFKNIYNDFFDNIIKYYTIYITFIYGDIERIMFMYNSYKNKIQYIKVKNKGYDIGPKIALLDFLYNNDILYNHILFLHAKKDVNKRKLYFKPLVGTADIIKKNIELIENQNNIGGIFPNMYKKEDNDLIKYSKNNISYITELLNLHDLKNNNITDFSEGNCMILKKSVIDLIFKNKTKLLYNMCNDKDSFDENWVRCRFNIPEILQSQQLYDDFIKNPNNYKLNNTLIAVGNNLANPNNDMPDGMYEHLWERVWVNFIYELNLEYISY